MPNEAGHATATVAFWDDDEGRGVIEAPDLDGGCWVHFSAFQGRGFLDLVVGSTVGLEWEGARQDGYSFRAVAVTT